MAATGDNSYIKQGIFLALAAVGVGYVAANKISKAKANHGKTPTSPLRVS
jgi:hypothetical protein